MFHSDLLCATHGGYELYKQQIYEEGVIQETGVCGESKISRVERGFNFCNGLGDRGSLK